MAERTGCAERYLAEWLAQQAVAGFLTYDPAAGRVRRHADAARVLRGGS